MNMNAFTSNNSSLDSRQIQDHNGITSGSNVECLTGGVSLRVSDQDTRLYECDDACCKAPFDLESAKGCAIEHNARSQREENWIKLMETLTETGRREDLRGSRVGINKVLLPTRETLPQRMVARETVHSVSEYFSCIHGAFEYLLSPENNLRMQLIMPIFVNICARFDHTYIVPKKIIEGGKYLDVIVSLTLNIHSPTRHIMFLEPQQGDFDDALSNILIACEIVAETKKTDVVYGVISNFHKWIFVRSSNAGLVTDECHLNMDSEGIPSPESLEVIMGKINAMLVDN
jgi:hypothetical protein